MDCCPEWIESLNPADGDLDNVSPLSLNRDRLRNLAEAGRAGWKIGSLAVRCPVFEGCFHAIGCTADGRPCSRLLSHRAGRDRHQNSQCGGDLSHIAALIEGTRHHGHRSTSLTIRVQKLILIEALPAELREFADALPSKRPPSTAFGVSFYSKPPPPTRCRGPAARRRPRNRLPVRPSASRRRSCRANSRAPQPIFVNRVERHPKKLIIIVAFTLSSERIAVLVRPRPSRPLPPRSSHCSRGSLASGRSGSAAWRSGRTRSRCC